MIKLLYGAKGSGKTGKIVEFANETVANCDGEVVFLTDSEKYVHKLNYNIRLINVTDYDIHTVLGLSGFVRGIIAGNHDVSDVFIDGIHRMTNTSVNDLQELFTSLEAHANKLNVNIICTISTDILPDYLAVYQSVKV